MTVDELIKKLQHIKNTSKVGGKMLVCVALDEEPWTQVDFIDVDTSTEGSICLLSADSRLGYYRVKSE